MKDSRRRLICGVALVTAIVAGLASRRFGGSLPQFIAAYAGDTLWAAAVYFLIVLIRPRARPLQAAVAALLISYVDEISQLYQAPWIDSIRRTTIGALVLGFGFLWSDIVCYTVGVALAVVIDWLLSGSIDTPAAIQ